MDTHSQLCFSCQKPTAKAYYNEITYRNYLPACLANAWNQTI